MWHGTKTELPFLNSLKMKMSILLGVTHMNVGIINSLFNHLYFKDNLSIICEFIPQMIFLNSLFGYLCMLIVGKWASGACQHAFLPFYVSVLLACISTMPSRTCANPSFISLLR